MYLKPIETHYKGYRFRSRLEARWAVFFDELGIEWEYEPEGFVLPDGELYLPDFWLRTCGAWFEIKPVRKLMAREVRKAKGIGTTAPILIVSGDPLEMFPFDAGNRREIIAFAPMGNGGVHGGKYDDRLGVIILLKHKFPALEKMAIGLSMDSYLAGIEAMRLIEAAGKKARSARFEFGESGE